VYFGWKKLRAARVQGNLRAELLSQGCAQRTVSLPVALGGVCVTHGGGGGVRRLSAGVETVDRMGEGFARRAVTSAPRACGELDVPLAAVWRVLGRRPRLRA
jgi:hypothetical protein